MAEPEWGAKRVCPTCATRFYDLQKDPVTCPGCGASFPVAALSERKATAVSRARAKPEKAAARAPVAAAAADELIDDDAETADDDVLLDDDEDDDDDDLGEIGDVAGNSNEDET